MYIKSSFVGSFYCSCIKYASAVIEFNIVEQKWSLNYIWINIPWKRFFLYKERFPFSVHQSSKKFLWLRKKEYCESLNSSSR